MFCPENSNLKTILFFFVILRENDIKIIVLSNNAQELFVKGDLQINESLASKHA
jgi:hypothetical protein